MRQRFRRKPDQFVTAVQLNLPLSTFTYQKWGAEQRAKRGDWLVDNAGDVYTIDQESFAGTYRCLRPGVYLKTTPVWVEQASHAGVVQTKEGQSHYAAGDYLVSNHADGSDAYCIAAEKFAALYERDE